MMRLNVLDFFFQNSPIRFIYYLQIFEEKNSTEMQTKFSVLSNVVASRGPIYYIHACEVR